MCGIAAAWSADGRSDGLAEWVAHLVGAQAHRGPDGEGTWSDGAHCVLGHRRLAVIDLSDGGRQPMLGGGGRYAVSYNGELYNFEALRAELEPRGHAFRSRSDTEVLLAAYAEWGDAAFARLDGMFALALYDTLERRLVLARDPAGEKPLFYLQRERCVAAASELRALATLPGAPRELDERGVFDFLALRYAAPPRTVLAGVQALEPGAVLAFGPRGAEPPRRYFAFDRAVDPQAGDVAGTIDALEDALAGSIERRLVSDVPLGAFLSCGVDSGLVCALAARRLRRELRTFSAGFAGGGADESAPAARVARELGLPHRSYAVSSDDLLATVRGFGALLDEPNGDRSCVPVYLLAREMRREVTVALSGDGGDELFCGYDRYGSYAAACAQARDPLDALECYYARALPVFAPALLARLFPDQHAAWREEFLGLYAPVRLRPGWNDAQRLSVLDFHTYLPGAVLAKVDRMSMRHALEVRTPYLEAGVMRLAAALPTALCPQSGPLKPVLRALLARYLDPALIATRKIGFGMPGGFMQAHRAIFDALFEAACESLRATRFFGARRAALDALAGAAPGNINSQWALTVLGMWAASLGGL